MTETLAVGGVLLLFVSVTGGIKVIETKGLKKEEFVPMGDRLAAVLVGAALIGLAAVLETGYHRWGLWIALALVAGAALWYAWFLARRL
jgi:hypothetical protein